MIIQRNFLKEELDNHRLTFSEYKILKYLEKEQDLKGSSGFNHPRISNELSIPLMRLILSLQGLAEKGYIEPFSWNEVKKGGGGKEIFQWIRTTPRYEQLRKGELGIR